MIAAAIVGVEGLGPQIMITHDVKVFKTKIIKFCPLYGWLSSFKVVKKCCSENMNLHSETSLQIGSHYQTVSRR